MIFDSPLAIHFVCMNPRWRKSLKANVDRKRKDVRLRELSSQPAQRAGASDLFCGPLGLGDPLGHWPLKQSDISARLKEFQDKEKSLAVIDENISLMEEYERQVKRRRALERSYSASKGAALEWETSIGKEHSQSCAPDTWYQAVRAADASVRPKGCCPMMHPGLCRERDNKELYASACDFAAAMARRSSKQKKENRYRSIFRFLSPDGCTHLWVLQAGGTLKIDDKIEVFQALRLSAADREEEMGMVCAQPLLSDGDLLRDMVFPYDLALVDDEKTFGPSRFTLPRHFFSHELALELCGLGHCAMTWSVEVCDFVPADVGLGVVVKGVRDVFDSVASPGFQLSAQGGGARQANTILNAWSPTVGFLKSVGCRVSKAGNVLSPRNRAPDVPDDAGSEEQSTEIEDEMRRAMLPSSSSSEGEPPRNTTRSTPMSLLKQIRVTSTRSDVAKPGAIESDAAKGWSAERVSAGNMVIERWGPVVFSAIKNGGVGAAWKAGTFLGNGFNNTRDGTVCTSGKQSLSQSECLLRVRRWVCRAFEAWMAGGDELEACFRCQARLHCDPTTAQQITCMRLSGLWTEEELQRCE